MTPELVRAYIALAQEFHLARLQVDGVDIYTTPATFPVPQEAVPEAPVASRYDNLDDILNDPDLYLNG